MLVGWPRWNITQSTTLGGHKSCNSIILTKYWPQLTCVQTPARKQTPSRAGTLTYTAAYLNRQITVRLEKTNIINHYIYLTLNCDIPTKLQEGSPALMFLTDDGRQTPASVITPKGNSKYIKVRIVIFLPHSHFRLFPNLHEVLGAGRRPKRVFDPKVVEVTSRMSSSPKKIIYEKSVDPLPTQTLF